MSAKIVNCKISYEEFCTDMKLQMFMLGQREE